MGAWELFRRFGLKSVTMDDIAKHLGISKKTIYQFWKDKDQLVDVLTTRVLEMQNCTICDLEAKSKNAIEEIMHMMEFMGSEFATMNPNLFYDMQKYYPSAWNKFMQFKEGYVMNSIARNIEKGQDEGLYRKDINVKVLARLRLEEVTLALNPAFYPADKFNISDVQMSLLDHFVHGICTLKGHKLINKYREIHEE